MATSPATETLSRFNTSEPLLLTTFPSEEADTVVLPRFVSVAAGFWVTRVSVASRPDGMDRLDTLRSSRIRLPVPVTPAWSSNGPPEIVRL